jgi:hypothetical protein
MKSFIFSILVKILISNGKFIDKIQNLSGNSSIYNTSKLAAGEYTLVITCGIE